MKQYCLQILLLLALGVSDASAQAAASFDSSGYYQLVDRYPAQQLGPKLEMYFDPEGERTIEEILHEGADQFFGPVRVLPPVVKPTQGVWLRVRVLPEIDLQHWWLMLKRDTTELEYITGYGEVDVYFVRNGLIHKHARTGIYVPASQKEIREINTICRVFTDFEAGVPTDIYLRIRENGAVFPELELRDPAFPLPNPVIGAYSGIQWMSHFALIIGVYVICFFVYTRDISYLYLFGMLACLFLHYHILHPYMPLIDWLFPEQPHWVNPTWSILTLGSFVFFLQFGRTFAYLKTISLFWDKVVKWSIWFVLLLLSVRLVAWGIYPSNPLLAEDSTAAISIMILLVLVIRLSFFKQILLRHFVFGGIWLFFFSIWGVLYNNGLVPFFDFPNPWMVAQAGFMIIYALALAYKIQLSERARSEVEKVRAVDSIKSRFFANISHEFRTPLSLILGPVNQALESIPASETIEEDSEIPIRGRYLKMIKRNALRLQNLVDQILDLSKLDQGKMQLQVAEGDVIKFIRAIVFSFESLAERKHIHFRAHFPQSIPSAWFDRDKLEKILVNLLSNAFKFTPEHGEVAVSLENTVKALKIIVSDTGSGMNASEAGKIFDRFYQVEGARDQGTGIGLSLVKELVDLHRGQISVDSTEGMGTTFKVTLPYLQADFQPHELVQQTQQDARSGAPFLPEEETTTAAATPNDETETEKPLLLIAEDNPDLRQYIADHLNPNYQVVTAPDGRQGLDLAQKKLPDLIISDVMMPGMSGLELCSALKKDVRTSHIPVILLTAKAGQEAKLEGLESGADAYLTKPFDGRELRIRVQKLIEQRAALREKFAGELKIRPTEVSLDSMEEQFMRRVMAEIEKNMDNEFYSVESLAAAVGFSRSQLHRKLKSLTGRSPNQLIREFRLERARELLSQRTASVSEIAYQVGYSNLSYFSKSYKEAFGVLPSET